MFLINLPVCARAGLHGTGKKHIIQPGALGWLSTGVAKLAIRKRGAWRVFQKQIKTIERHERPCPILGIQVSIAWRDMKCVGVVVVVVVIQLLSRVQLFATPWTVAHQASLFFTISQSLLKLMSEESMMPSKHLTLCHQLFLPSIFPSIRVFTSESKLFTSSGQSIGASASTDWLQLIINSRAKGLYFTYYYISNSSWYNKQKHILKKFG